jgi:geranylgeranyl pyrophosphate synthase
LSSTLNGERTRRTRRRKTTHLKLVPDTKALRSEIREQCIRVASRFDASNPLGKDRMEAVAREILESMKQPEGFVGWTMVMLSSAFWRSQVASIPYDRRLFLLPHCLKHAEGCPADYDQFGLDCKTCGACSIADFRGNAEKLGYKVLVAEGSPIVLKIIVSGHVDAIVGVACLNVLEKAIDKILLAGIPCMAVPLLSSDCRNTSVDEDWVSDMVNVPYEPVTKRTKSYIHLLRGSSHMFQAETLDQLAPRIRSKKQLSELNGKGIMGLDPIAGTEAIAYDFLGKGGKHSRPFITLAVYDAVTGGKATDANGAEIVQSFSDSVRRAALSIETFHKASLVHDDIEDDDQFRYGEPSVHSKFGIPTAINVGDYLVGLGYRLISREAATLGAETATDILDALADAHQRLSEGQGAELLWRDSGDKRLKPIDALKIYALKTSPAFEAAFHVGLRLAGPIDQYRETVKTFSRNLGVAFQILNDLKDWEGDSDNKLESCGDLLSGRPTVLWATALEGLSQSNQSVLMELVDNHEIPAAQRIQKARKLYLEADVFEQAYRLVDKHQVRAEKIADEIEPVELRNLMYYLVDTVLDRSESVKPTINIVEPTMADALPVIARS